MRPALLVVAPPYVTERKLRITLDGCNVVTFSFARSIHGTIWKMDFSTLEDRNKAETALLSLRLDDHRPLTVEPVESPQAATLLDIFTSMRTHRPPGEHPVKAAS